MKKRSSKMIKKIKQMRRLTNARIDAIQYFYGHPFRDKKGNVLKMSKKV